MIALSSGESEFYGGIKAGATLLGALATMKDLGCEGVMVFDASAARAMLSRRWTWKIKQSISTDATCGYNRGFKMEN